MMTPISSDSAEAVTRVFRPETSCATSQTTVQHATASIAGADPTPVPGPAVRAFSIGLIASSVVDELLAPDDIRRVAEEERNISKRNWGNWTRWTDWTAPRPIGTIWRCSGRQSVSRLPHLSPNCTCPESMSQMSVLLCKSNSSHSDDLVLQNSISVYRDESHQCICFTTLKYRALHSSNTYNTLV
jgi:hypothetical protein